jgi:tagaturonate reductase
VPVLHCWYRKYNNVPDHIATGFAAWLQFMKVVKKEDTVYFGELNGALYPVKDEMAGYFYEQWQNLSADQLVTTVLSNTGLWGSDLTLLAGFAESVSVKLKVIMQHGILAVLQVGNK